MEQAIATIQTLSRLAETAANGLPLGPGALVFGADGELSLNRPHTPARHHFWLDGLLFHISITPEDDTTLFQIWAEVGFMPYTIENPEKRARLQTILRAAGSLTNARFVVDDQQKILVLGQTEIDGHVALPDLMYEAMLFLQECRPFLRVLGDYL